ncbi:MAG: hypothetical protein ACP5RP_03515 [Candidatus Micrarchaeia archaeon]
MKGIKMNILKLGDYAKIATMLLVVILNVGVIISQGQQGQAATLISQEMCAVFDTIKQTIFIIGIALMVLGAALYAMAHLLPASQKGQIQGYGMGMLMGGVIGVIIAILAKPILGAIASMGSLPTGGCT